LDKTTGSLLPNESSFLLNHDVNYSGALDKGVPLGANFLACDMQLPAGENHSPSSFYSELTNESYSWHYNSNGVHFISRINGDGQCQIVYVGECLELDADPKHDITQWRSILDVDFLCNKVPGGKLKRLVWTNGVGQINCLDVEASIATNNFTTPFFDICPDPCAYLQLCVPEPQGCLYGEFVPFTDADKGMSNKILDKGFKFAYRHVYYDQRASELSAWSTLFYQDAKGCFDNSESFSRCIKFRLPIGNPMVDKIEFYFSEDGGLTWFLYDTIEKYKKYNSAQEYWYQRNLSEEVQNTFDDSDCAFDYFFCNDKQRIPANPKLITRVLNPIPRDVQGLFRIKDTIAAYNYELGNCPIDKVQAEKFDVNIDCTGGNSCNVEFAKVTVRAIVYVRESPSLFPGGMNGFIHRFEGTPGNNVEDLNDPAWFGVGERGFDQTFAGKIRNFIPYIEGTNYWGQMEQYKAQYGFTNITKIGVLAALRGDNIAAVQAEIASSTAFYFQEYTFTVPKGMKGIIRLASHHKENGLSDNQDSSTQVWGTLGANGLKTYYSLFQIPVTDETKKEIYFDTCNGDFDNYDAFVVTDLLEGDNGGYSGYITDKDNNPVEGALIKVDTNVEAMTDFNGYYFFNHIDALIPVSVLVEQDCGIFSQVASFNSQAGKKGMTVIDHKIESQTYNDSFHAKVNVAVKDCVGLPLRGIRVAISGGKYEITDGDGIAHFKVRNYPTRNRIVTAMVMDKGNCFTVDCNDNCNPCMPYTGALSLASCFNTTPEYSIATTSNLNTRSLSLNKRGLKLGGRYPFGFIIDFGCGKLSAVNEIKYIDIPKAQDIGNLSFCTLNYNANGIKLQGARSIKIVRGKNVNSYYLQWVIDKIERTSDNRIKLTIQSLNDYNTQYNFKTNTVYQYLAGDRVEFIKNGDGKIFDTLTYGVLNYQVLSPFNDEVISGVTNDVNFFNQILIADDSRLDLLKEGAVIELQSATTSRENIEYSEVCATIPIDVDGNVIAQSGTFETFDTYFVNRQIDKFPAQYFEHKSPSDFWGGNSLDDLGKTHFLNPYENEKRYPRNISINSGTQLNYFGDFVKKLDAEEQGGIVSVNIKDDKIGIAICENDSFIFQVSDDLLRIGNDGVLRAATVDSVISNPEAKLVGKYGCKYQDIGSVLFGDGYALFFDGRVDSYIIHNYSVAKIAGASVEEGEVVTSCNSYFKKRNRNKENFNKTATNFLDHFRFSTGINKVNGVVYLTLKSLRHSGVMNEMAPYIAPNETLMYNPANDSFLGFASFTPESYSQLILSTDEGCSFLTYQNSQPYIHEQVPTKWNQFFGVSCDWHVSVTLNKFPDKLKIPISLEGQSDTLFFVSKVTTDKPNFESEIPPKKVKLIYNKFNAAFLSNKNSRTGLYGNETARGYEINVLFTRNNSVNLEYGSIDNGLREAYSELGNILFKFQVIEQSGFSGNL